MRPSRESTTSCGPGCVGKVASTRALAASTMVAVAGVLLVMTNVPLDGTPPAPCARSRAATSANVDNKCNARRMGREREAEAGTRCERVLKITDDSGGMSRDLRQ